MECGYSHVELDAPTRFFMQLPPETDFWNGVPRGPQASFMDLFSNITCTLIFKLVDGRVSTSAVENERKHDDSI